MLDLDTGAAKSFYREVRKFAQRTKPWDTTAIYYETQPDEVFDITLVAWRVYGRDDEYLTVMAAAGMDTPYQPLRQQRIVLPSAGQLLNIKRRTGFESIAMYRNGGTPTWQR